MAEGLRVTGTVNGRAGHVPPTMRRLKRERGQLRSLVSLSLKEGEEKHYCIITPLLLCRIRKVNTLSLEGE